MLEELVDEGNYAQKNMFEATGERGYLDKAVRIAELIIHRHARAQGRGLDRASYGGRAAAAR